jgi:NitT/TauT family transport system substrate-binding protein
MASLRARWPVIVSTMLAAASSANFPATAQQNKIQIGLPVPNYGPYVPIFAAQDLGFYKKNGVEVDITTYRGGPAAQEALAIGSADMIVSAPAAAALAIKKGIEEKIVGAVSNSANGFYIVVLSNSPITAVKDLGGKSVGVSAAGSLVELYLLWAAKQAGVHVNAIPVGPQGLVPSLKARQVDAASLYSPLAYKLIVLGEGRSIFDVGRDMPPAIPESWVATQALIDKNPKAVAAILQSFYEAVAYLKKNQEISISFLKKYTGEENEKVLELERNDVLNNQPIAARIDLEGINFALELANLQSITVNLPSVDQIYKDTFASVAAN